RIVQRTFAVVAQVEHEGVRALVVDRRRVSRLERQRTRARARFAFGGTEHARQGGQRQQGEKPHADELRAAKAQSPLESGRGGRLWIPVLPLCHEAAGRGRQAWWETENEAASDEPVPATGSASGYRDS